LHAGIGAHKVVKATVIALVTEVVIIRLRVASPIVAKLITTFLLGDLTIVVKPVSNKQI
jgi:hypothetical protein